jgi:predicted TIM-barrel fold metal-dependent hydrolase
MSNSRNDVYFDTHCHIFTLGFALKEARNMLHDMLLGTYPWDPPDVRDTRTLIISSQSDIKDFMMQFYELVSASFGSEEENLLFLLEKSSQAMPGFTWRITPLMMDIFYMFAYPLDAGELAARAKAAPSVRVDEDEIEVVFDRTWNEILDDLKRHIIALERDERVATGGARNHFLQAIEDEREIGQAATFKAGLGRTEGFHGTAGYCFHLDNLVRLVKQHTGELFPFIAVDPRRPGIIDAVVGGDYIGSDGPFYGVKLYPRMGYHPQAAPLYPLYRYCNDRKIPITFHCGKSGFPPGTGWKHADFGNPGHFESILRDYPDLNINFAHLGSADSSHEWAHTIIDLMNRYENAYSDLSCYTDIGDLTYVKTSLWDGNPILKSRLMFGTDFDVMYLTDQITMEEYFANFNEIFSEDDLKHLMHDNPLSFFGNMAALS